MTPGDGRGVPWLGDIQPAFPYDAPAQISAFSSSTTRAPRSARCHAEATPTIPPPITIASARVMARR
jgi:hypothetical protein